MDDEIKENIGSWEVPAVFPEPLWRGHYPGDLTALQEKTLEFLNNSEKLNTALEGGRGASSSSEHEMPHMWRESADFYAWLARPMKKFGPSGAFQKCHQDEFLKVGQIFTRREHGLKNTLITELIK